MFVLYLVCIHKEEDEQNQLCQQNYQQDNEELEGKKQKGEKGGKLCNKSYTNKLFYYAKVTLVSCIL